MEGDEDLFPNISEEELKHREQEGIDSMKKELLERLKKYEFDPNYRGILAIFGGIPVSLVFDEREYFCKRFVKGAVIALDREKKVVPILWGTNIFLTDFIERHDILNVILKLPGS